MRTLPEIVAEMKELIAELETHTGKPPAKESYSHDYYNNMNYSSGGIELCGAAMPVVSPEFYNMGFNGTSANDLITINLSEYKISTPST